MPLAAPDNFLAQRQNVAKFQQPAASRSNKAPQPPVSNREAGPKSTEPISSPKTPTQSTRGDLPKVEAKPLGYSGNSTSFEQNMSNPTAVAEGTGEMNLMSRLFAVESSINHRIAELELELKALKESTKKDGNLPKITLKEAENVDTVMAEPSSATARESRYAIAVSEAAARTPSDRWMPLAIRKLAPYRPKSLQTQPLALEIMNVTFTLEFLVNFLGGAEYSPGFYYPAVKQDHHRDLKIKSKTFYALDAKNDPFLPLYPGEHGAKLTVFFHDFDDPKDHYENVPLFIAMNPPGGERKGPTRYTYFGSYSQSRWSDKLDHDRIAEVVPDHVKRYWAEMLGDKKNRPEWMEKALMEHFWTKPEYEGDIPVLEEEDGAASGENAAADRVTEGVKEFVEELVDWKKEAIVKVGLLKKENIYDAFGQADADSEPGLRFWWEYFQCTGFDRNFYYILATEMKKLDGQSFDLGSM